MISHDHRCIFVHIPKTAGNSVNRVFGIGWEDHKDLARFAAELDPEIFARYFKFAIVRNPWERIFSDYNYQVKKSRPDASKLGVFRADGSQRTFAEWLDLVLAEPELAEPERWGGAVSPHIHRWSPQVDWLKVGDRIGVDFVARLENLPDDFATICARVGLSATRLPHRNRKGHRHYSRYYDRHMREQVATYYASDIATFDYRFEVEAPTAWVRFDVSLSLASACEKALTPWRVAIPLAAAVAVAWSVFLFTPNDPTSAPEAPPLSFFAGTEARPRGGFMAFFGAHHFGPRHHWHRR